MVKYPNNYVCCSYQLESMICNRNQSHYHKNLLRFGCISMHFLDCIPTPDLHRQIYVRKLIATAVIDRIWGAFFIDIVSFGLELIKIGAYNY